MTEDRPTEEPVSQVTNQNENKISDNSSDQNIIDRNEDFSIIGESDEVIMDNI